MNSMYVCRAAFAACVFVAASSALADTFGTGANQFDIDFVTISGSTNPPTYHGYGIVNDDYRMGMLEISNDQWTKFTNSLGVPVTGNPTNAYDNGASFGGSNVAANGVSWYEAAQFVNYLNTSHGYQAAYRFTGTQGTSNYTFANWSIAESDGGTNRYRHKDAMYFMPTEDEWIKAAYWNGTNLQAFTTVGDVTPVIDVDANYYVNIPPILPWDVGSGSEELNGTYDMAGNMWEWTEDPFGNFAYGTTATTLRGIRGGSYNGVEGSGFRVVGNGRGNYPNDEFSNVGFRVATSVPEIAALVDISFDAPVVNSGPLSFGLSVLPANPTVTIAVGNGTPAGGGATTYGLADVVSADLIFGDGVFTNLEAFNMEVLANGSIAALSYTFAPHDTASVTDGIIALNSPLNISGTDIASGDSFSYTYGNSVETFTSVPEPTTCTLALAALCLAMSRRRTLGVECWMEK